MTQEWLENFGLINQIDFSNVPADIEAEVDELTEWLEWLQKLSAEADVMRARLDRQRFEREATEARIAEITERQRIETEREMEEERLLKYQQQIAWLRARIDTVCDKIIRQMKERQARLEREAAEQAIKAKEDLRVWELFKRQILDPVAKKPDVPPSEIESARTKHDYRKVEPAALADKDIAAWEAYTQRLTQPSAKERAKLTEKAEQEKALARQREQQEKLLREFEAFQNKQPATAAENQAQWDAFAQFIKRKR